jgi:hypothetical protein
MNERTNKKWKVHIDIAPWIRNQEEKIEKECERNLLTPQAYRETIAGITYSKYECYRLKAKAWEKLVAFLER